MKTYRSNKTVPAIAKAVEEGENQYQACKAALDMELQAHKDWLNAVFEERTKQLREMFAQRVAMKSSDETSQLPKEAVVRVKALKKKDLQKELSRRNLAITGLKADLVERLLEAMEQDFLAKRNNSPPMETDAPPMAPVNTNGSSVGSKPSTSSPSRASAAKVSAMDCGAENIAVDDDFDLVMEDVVDSPKKPAAVSKPKSESESSGRKRVRSPLKLVQSIMSPAKGSKVAKIAASPPPKPAPAMDDSTAVEAMQAVSISSDIPFAMDVEPIVETAPPSQPTYPMATVLSGSHSKHGMSSSLNKQSALSKEALQAKRDTPKTHLEKIRNKAKHAVSATKLKPVRSTEGALSSTDFKHKLPVLSSSTHGGTTTKQKNMMQQMREKAFAKAAANSSSAAVSAPKSTSKPPANSPIVKSSAKKSPKKESSSPLDTYELSDREESDSEEDESKKKPKKRIPSWAKTVNLNKALEHQYSVGRLQLDPDEIFGEVDTCDLDAIFADSKKSRFRQRTSSGNWSKDRVTSVEKADYKRSVQDLALRRVRA